MKPTLINLCPHPISYSTVIEGRPQMVTLDPSPTPCRVQTESHDTGLLPGDHPIIVQCQTYGRVTGLPDPRPHTYYVVSGIVLAALKERGVERPDILSPATGPRDNALRDGSGNVVAVAKFNVLSMPQHRGQERAA